MFPFDFLALPPEVNAARILGPGPGPMIATAESYAELARGLAATAAGSEGAMGVLGGGGWTGPSSDMAQGAFHKHALWLREHALMAAEVATLAAEAVGAYELALFTMPPLPAVLANRALSTSLALSNGMGQNTAAILALEALYLGMWVQAANAMSAYATTAAALISALPPPIPAPPISSSTPTVPDGGGFDLLPTNGNPRIDQGRPPLTQDVVGPRPGDPPGKPPVDNGIANPDQPPPDIGQLGGPDPTQTTPDPTQPGPDPTQTTTPPEAQQAISDVEQAMSGMNDSLAEPGQDGNGESDWQHGFHGTSPYSTTLAGLTGGVGSLVAIGMLGGGLGSMSGAASGFRMPANWAPGSGTAFGAGTGAVQGAPASAPRRGVTAPVARMRRRRKDEEKDKPAKVFVPGEEFEVPVLERPPAIGVIEYDDDETELDIVADAVLVGVLEHSDDEAATTTERPR
ncbi:PPE family protein [Nocardia cyriacigeorgica]|uniref:PPE family protein n=1 Tax=Nocardia cyriacigeorgica TaxID=135487 RepID=UPI0024577DB0|nr:PPE family protein [Nocardia cyriacigeorgica]